MAKGLGGAGRIAGYGRSGVGVFPDLDERGREALRKEVQEAEGITGRRYFMNKETGRRQLYLFSNFTSAGSVAKVDVLNRVGDTVITVRGKDGKLGAIAGLEEKRVKGYGKVGNLVGLASFKAGYGKQAIGEAARETLRRGLNGMVLIPREGFSNLVNYYGQLGFTKIEPGRRGHMYMSAEELRRRYG
jgi:hypothetical protein